MGRPRKQLPANGIDIISNLASRGIQETMLAKALGLSLKTWQRIRAEDPAAKEAYEAAKSAERDLLVGELFAQATQKHNTVAAIFLLKSRHGYRDFGPSDGSTEPRVALHINIPGPLKPEDYAKLLTVAPPQLTREAA